MTKNKKVKTEKIELTMSELEVAYVACSNYMPPKSYTKWKPRVQIRTADKLREALLTAVLNK